MTTSTPAAPVSVVWALIAATAGELVVGFWPSRTGPDFGLPFWLHVLLALLTATAVALPWRARPYGVGFTVGLSLTAAVLPLSLVGAPIDAGSVHGLVLELVPVLAWAVCGGIALFATRRYGSGEAPIRSPVAFHIAIGGAILAAAAVVVRPTWFGLPGSIGGGAEIGLSLAVLVGLPVIAGAGARWATTLRSTWVVAVAVELFLFLARWGGQFPWASLPRPWNGVASVALFGGGGMLLASAVVLYLAARRPEPQPAPAVAAASMAPAPAPSG